MIILVKPLLFLTVHAPPAFAFSFYPEMVLITLFGLTNFTDSSSAGRLPNMFILILLISHVAVSAFDACAETSYPPMVLLTQVIYTIRLNKML